MQILSYVITFSRIVSYSSVVTSKKPCYDSETLFYSDYPRITRKKCVLNEFGAVANNVLAGFKLHARSKTVFQKLRWCIGVLSCKTQERMSAC